MSDIEESTAALRRVVADRARFVRLGEQLAAAEQLERVRTDELVGLRDRLRGEEADVRRIEGLSPSRLWATLRGDVDDRVARERGERDAAQRAVESAESRLRAASAQVAQVRSERDALGDVEGSYAFTLAAHERVVRASGGAHATELAEVATGLGEATDDLREVDEALTALREATDALQDAFAKLESAGGWSTYDTFFGGGFVGDLMKHGRIDEATTAFGRVNRALDRLAIELEDVGLERVHGVEMSQSLAVFDVLFDNVFSDWMVRDRIAQAREAAVTLRLRLSDLERRLAERRLETARRIADLAARRETLLLPPG